MNLLCLQELADPPRMYVHISLRLLGICPLHKCFSVVALCTPSNHKCDWQILGTPLDLVTTIMAGVSSAYLQYDSDIFTNYVQDPKDPVGSPQTVQSYTINLQCLDVKAAPMAGASVLIQTSAPAIANLNGTTVMLSTHPYRYALDVTGELGIIAPATGLSSPSYTFSYLKDQKGNSINMPVTTIDPSRKALAQFESIKTGGQLKSAPGRAGTTLYANKSPPPDADLDAAAKTFQDLSTAAKNLPTRPANVQTACMFRKFDSS